MNKKLLFLFMITIISAFFIQGCSTIRPVMTYSPPLKNQNQENYTRTINKNFNDTWNSLISYVSGTFFGIENFEKESGLITLSFGSSEPEKFVTGGQWKIVPNDINVEKFDGDYVEYMTKYENGKLLGKMNIVVKKIDSTHSMVTVNAKYYFTSQRNWYSCGLVTHTWEFSTGNCQELNLKCYYAETIPNRTLCPTYKAENSILEAIEKLD